LLRTLRRPGRNITTYPAQIGAMGNCRATRWGSLQGSSKLRTSGDDPAALPRKSSSYIYISTTISASSVLFKLGCQKPFLQHTAHRRAGTGGGSPQGTEMTSILQRLCALLSLLSFFLAVHASPADGVEKFLSRSGHTNNWAVLVSTSRFWFNYRVFILAPRQRTLRLTTVFIAHCEHTVNVSDCEASWHSRLPNHPHARR
jgi:hypothetical protein